MKGKGQGISLGFKGVTQSLCYTVDNSELVRATDTALPSDSVVAGQVCSSAAVFPTNTWTHVAVIHDKHGTATLYVTDKDGADKVVASGKVPMPLEVARSQRLIGALSAGPTVGETFMGAMSDLNWWDTDTVTIEQIRKASSAHPDSAGVAPVRSRLALHCSPTSLRGTAE
jgi:hypothetical protein